MNLIRSTEDDLNLPMLASKPIKSRLERSSLDSISSSSSFGDSSPKKRAISPNRKIDSEVIVLRSESRSPVLVTGTFKKSRSKSPRR